MSPTTRRAVTFAFMSTSRLNVHHRLTRGEIRKHCVELTGTLVVHPSPKISARANRPFGKCLPPPAEHGCANFAPLSWARQVDDTVTMTMRVSSLPIAWRLNRRRGCVCHSVDIQRIGCVFWKKLGCHKRAGMRVSSRSLSDRGARLRRSMVMQLL